MLHGLLAISTILTIGCSPAPSPAAIPDPDPFPDLVLGSAAGFGTDREVTELVTPLDVVVVGATPNPIVFLRKDPNNGCRLALASDLDPAGGTPVDRDAVFVDRCHGNLYDIAGRPLIGVHPMTTIPTEVRDGELVWNREGVRAAADVAAG